VSLAPAMWWIGTVLPTEVGSEDDPDYVWRPISLADRTRHVTTPVIGANIGGGLALLGAGHFAIAMFAVAVVFVRRLRREPSAQ
jgi:hypothetical protein